MAAAAQSHTPDRTTTGIIIAEEQPANTDNMKDQQPLSAKNETSVSPNAYQEPVALGHPRDGAAQSGSVGSAGDFTCYSPTMYAPQPQAFYYRGYNNPTGDWDEHQHTSYVNAEGLEMGSPGVYNENPSLVFHTGYGYNPQMPYTPYSPVTTPVPSVGGDAQLYSPQQYPFSGQPYYQQVVNPSMPYITSPNLHSQPELTSLVSVDQQGDNNMMFGTRPSYPPSPVGSFGRGNFTGNPGFPDWQQGYDGLRSGGIWSDWPKPSDRQRPLAPISPAASSQPIGPLGSFGQNVAMGSQRQKSFYRYGSGSNSCNNRSYLHSSFNQGSTYGNAPNSGLGMNNQGWLAIDSGRQRGRGGGSSICGCNGTLDILNEQNRGPRALKPKTLVAGEHNSEIDDKQNKFGAKIHDESYNKPDFVTEHKDARFFIIKSYSEDNVHKSVKYGVWASTPNGNKRLDTAYREAKEKQDPCPVFLFFSVNASAQFCGVAEMVGLVDFEKSVDYWQQDKWSGQFPVKWQIIKDIPNNQFRHIVLENNDNKPVTNSRDTQEVKLEQGIEMLNIFKNYKTDTSILDDFEFYEDRQKVMQERKVRRQTTLMSVGVVGENDHRNTVALSSDYIKQLPKSFAQVVRLDEVSKVTDKPSSPAETTAAPVPSAETK